MTGPFAHFCGIHMAKKDPKFQLVVQHYCVAHTDGHEGGEQLFQCILFDSTEKNAKLIKDSASDYKRLFTLAKTKLARERGFTL